MTALEYRKVKRGTTLARAHEIFGTRGRLLFQNPGSVTNGAREYPMCVAWARRTGDRKVQIQYNNYNSRGGAFRVAYIQRY